MVSKHHEIKKVIVINGSDDSIISAINVGIQPVSVAVDLDTNTIYVANSTLSLLFGHKFGHEKTLHDKKAITLPLWITMEYRMSKYAQ